MHLVNLSASNVAASKSCGTQSNAIDESIRIVPEMQLILGHFFQVSVAQNKACWELYHCLKPDSWRDNISSALKDTKDTKNSWGNVSQSFHQN